MFREPVYGLLTNIYRLFQISVTHHRIPFDFFAVLVNGKGFPAVGEEYAAVETSGLFSCDFCSAKGFFMGSTIIQIRPHCSSFSAKIIGACAKVRGDVDSLITDLPRCHEMKKPACSFISWPDFPGFCAKQGHEMKNSMHFFISWRAGQFAVALSLAARRGARQ